MKVGVRSRRPVRKGSPGAELPPAVGAGPNAPTWSGKLTYPLQQFATPIPVTYETPVNGFVGQQGFPDAYGAAWLPARVSYPTVSTPLGTKPVLQVTYPGQSEAITASGQTTTPYPWAGVEYTNVSIRISGTWSGTLVFETSVDGTTWTAQSMTGFSGSSSGTATTVNGRWTSDSTADRTPYDYFRVRASSWSSGTATVVVGMQGGQAPARAGFGELTGTPSRVYLRMVYRTSSNWTDAGNVGTKLLFFSKITEGGQQNNHYISMTDGTVERISPSIATQVSGWGSNTNVLPSQDYAHGTWIDLEVILQAGTAGVADGVVQAWVNGSQVINRSDIALFGSAQLPAFYGFYFDPTFGGGINCPIGQNVQIAHFYYESAA